MASRRRNIKTHPKPTGDGAQDTFAPPDRPDQPSGVDDGRLEVVDVFAKESTVELSGDDGSVDQNSQLEGDGRSLASEGDGDDDADDTRSDGVADEGDGRGARRGTRGARDQDADEGGSYSKRVRERIARERALTNRERALREQTQRELTEERAARQAQEERIARLERAQTEVAGNAGVKEIEAKIDALKPQLAAAMEAGETAKVLELNDKLADLRADLKVLKYDLAQKQRQAEAARTTAADPTRGTKTEVVDDPRVKKLVDQFFTSNRHWWNRSANKDARDDTITIDKEILGDISAGDLAFEPYSDEHFEELARRLHESHPDLEIQDLAGNPYTFEDEDEEDDMNDTGGNRNGRQNNGRQNNGRQSNGQRQNGGRAPVGRMGQNGRRAATEVDLARQGKVTLDQNDFQTMRLFKMDPNDPTAKKYFAKEKMRSILSGQRGGQR